MVKRYSRVFALFAVFALVLAACGGSGTGDTTTTAGDTTTTAGNTTTTAGATTTTAGETTTTVGPDQVSVEILEGAGKPQDLDSPDEFADTESPADYSINVLTIKVGTKVKWTNSSSKLHTVTEVGFGFDSGFLDAGQTFSRTFEDVGEFEYFCQPHPWMRAKVIIEN